MTREEAVDFLCQIADEMQEELEKSRVPRRQWTYGKHIEAISAAISALREQDKAPCEYCNGTRRRLPIFDDPEVGSFNTILFSEGKAFLEDADGNYIGIRACPMCGRRLEV